MKAIELAAHRTTMGNSRRCLNVPTAEAKVKLEALLGVHIYGKELQITEDTFEKYAVRITGILAESYVRGLLK